MKLILKAVFAVGLMTFATATLATAANQTVVKDVHKGCTSCCSCAWWNLYCWTVCSDCGCTQG